MSTRYRITPEGPRRLSDAEVESHRDGKRLFYNYHQAVRPLYHKPLYKDRRAFIALLIIVLLAILVAEAVEKEHREAPSPREQTH